MPERNWDAFARKLETALDMRSAGRFRDLFAPNAEFADPANTPTTDLRDVQRQTAAVFPDWHQEITSIRGGESWAVFEWIGRATFKAPAGAEAVDGTPITMHGASIIELDDDGLITSWRDYLDRKEPEDQLRRAGKRPQRG